MANYRFSIRLFAFLAVAALNIGTQPAFAQEPDSLETRKQYWQVELKTIKLDGLGRIRDPLQSIRKFDADCNVEIHSETHTRIGGFLTFRFMKGDKELASITGHDKSVFGAWKNRLYFVHYNPSTDGATVASYDLATGKQLWKSKLKGIDQASQFAYSNAISISMMNDSTLKQGEMLIEGHESNGNYLEVIDLETGQMLANRQFKNADIPKREDYKQE